MNLLTIHETNYLTEIVYEYQIITELLSSYGHSVYTIDYPSGRKKGVFFDLGTLKTKYLYNVRKANKKRGITLIRPGMIQIPGLGRFSSFITHFFAIRKAIKDYHINRILLFSATTNGLQTFFWAKVFKIPVLFRLLDATHLLISNRLLSLPTYLAERFVYKHSDEILADTPRLTKYAVKMGANPKTTSYLPSGADSDLFYPTKKDSNLLKKYGLTSKDIIILFAGRFYNFSGLDDIITAMPGYLKKMPNLKLLILGRGEQQNKLHNIIKTLGLEKIVILTGFKKYNDVPKHINLSDICINPFRFVKATKVIIPGKIYQYSACGKPTLASKLPGMLDIYPLNDKTTGIYYFNTTNDFFELIPKVIGARFKDPNPSLQAITEVIERKLEEMKI